MLIIMRTDASQDQIAAIVSRVEVHGLTAHLSQGEERTVIGVVGDSRAYQYHEQVMHLPGVDRIMPISRPYKLASREFIPENSHFPLDGVDIGGPGVVIIAGPCAVESREQILETAQAVQEAGAHALRGGAYKPRTSPYSFQGLGEKGLQYLAEARQATGLPIVTEVMSTEQVPVVAQYADVLQIGARNMQNFSLLHMAGGSTAPHPRPPPAVPCLQSVRGAVFARHPITLRPDSYALQQLYRPRRLQFQHGQLLPRTASCQSNVKDPGSPADGSWP